MLTFLRLKNNLLWFFYFLYQLEGWIRICQYLLSLLFSIFLFWILIHIYLFSLFDWISFLSYSALRLDQSKTLCFFRHPILNDLYQGILGPSKTLNIWLSPLFLNTIDNPMHNAWNGVRGLWSIMCYNLAPLQTLPFHILYLIILERINN